MEELAKQYEPKEAEKKWYHVWEERGYFKPEVNPDGESYTIVIPPPNVTGSLHIGHALNNTLQDSLIRYKRMDGYRALWVPGTDHAGIATQMMVEKSLAVDGKTRHDVGREKFLEIAWQWKAQHGGRIVEQLRELGCSCDWTRERFTLNDGLSAAVREVFVRLHEEGLIYRGKRLINWCPVLHTAVSDLEVERKENKGHLWHMRYPIKGEEGRFMIVATTRPETMLGDTAVAVHPEDERYADVIGKTCVLPLTGREIPIIADEYVDREFGTGAVKITPAHDFNDFEMGKRHDLEFINIFDIDASINDNAPEDYRGLDRYDARKKVVAELDEQGLLEKIEDHDNMLGYCQRSGAVIEPYLSDQWFVTAKPLADKALAAVKDGRTRFVPKNWEKTYFDWLENIQDWCISRQLWWGHRIPAWHCEDCAEITVTREDPSECGACGSKNITQDPDVLDTWFSSALWPFSTLGWPEETEDLAKHYPTSVLITSFDIIFFWVARMMMSGIHYRDEVPFADVYIHALVRDAEGQNMSKTKGNVVDPLEVMGKFGTDALRLTLIALAAQGRDIKMSDERVVGYRNFCNKLWNAARFTLPFLVELKDSKPPAEIKAPVNRWIVSRANDVVRDVRAAFDSYEFNNVGAALYQFIWHEFCDWYLEVIKPVLYDTEHAEYAETTQVLAAVLEKMLRTLHPVMPFITEEIWQRLPGAGESIMVAPFPTFDESLRDDKAVAEFELLSGFVTAVRNIRGEGGISPSVEISVKYRATDADHQLIDETRDQLLRLAKIGELERLPGAPGAGEPLKGAASALAGEVEVYVPLAGLIDVDAERARLDKERGKVAAELKRVEGKLSNEKFVANAPADVVDKQKRIKAELDEQLAHVEKSLERLADM